MMVFSQHYRFVFYAVLWGYAFTMGSLAQEPAPDLFVASPVYDFGKKDNSQTVVHTFVLENRGDRVLEIERTRTSCGCTVAKLPSRTIPPGESVDLTVNLSLKNRKGLQQKAITILSNDPDTPNYRLVMKGEAVAEISLSPNRVFLRALKQDDVKSQTINIVGAGQPFRITGIQNAVDQVEAKVVTVVEGKHYQLNVSTKPPLQEGRFQGQIILNTDHPKRPQIPVIVMGDVVGPISFQPETLALSGKNQNPLTRFLFLRAGTDPSLVIDGVDVPDDRIRVQIFPQGKNAFRVQLANVVPDASLNGKEIVIRTQSEAMPEIRIPVHIIGAAAR